jgi:PAS domain S-box-containing protein
MSNNDFVSLQAILSALPAYVYWKDVDGVYLGCNESEAAVIGLPIKEIIGKTDHDLIWHESADELRKNDLEVIQKQSALCFEETIRIADGSVVTAVTHKVPLFEGGAIIGVLGVSMDITSKSDAIKGLKEAKNRAENAEKKSLESQMYLDNVISHIPGNVYWKDKEGRLLGCNKANEERLLCILPKGESPFGKTDYDLWPHAIAKKVRVNDLEVMKSGQLKRFEEVSLMPDGSVQTFISDKAPMRDYFGEVIGVLGSSINITEHKQKETELIFAKENAEKAKKNTEIYLQNIIANLPVHVFWLDVKGIILGCNEAQAKSVGVESPDEIIGKSIYQVGDLLGWSKEIIARHRVNDEAVIHKLETVTVEEDVVWQDGEMRTFISKKTPLCDESGVCIGMLGMAFDITERKQVENKILKAKQAAETANIIKTNFIANMSHDLRTPMHIILGSAELLKIKKHFPEQVELIDGIIDSGKSLLKLIEEILDYTTIEVKHREQTIETFDITQLVENIISKFISPSAAKNIELLISCGEEVPRYVVGNSQHIRRIVTNLVDNAVKFTRQGYVLVALELVEEGGHDVVVQINVEDTGIGIDKLDISHIFDRFYRGVPSYISDYKGTGLGLAITKQLSETMGGKLDVYSQKGTGTTFSCTLPLQKSSKVVLNDFSSHKIEYVNALVIDDHKKRRETITSMLPFTNKSAMTSLQLSNARVEAIQRFNLIIVDDSLEMVTVNDFYDKLRRTFEGKKLPVVVFVANHVETFPAQCEPGSLVVEKPLQPTRLYQKIIPAWEVWYRDFVKNDLNTRTQSIQVLLVEDEPLIQCFTKQLLESAGCEVSVAESGNHALEMLNNSYDIVFMDIGLPDIDGLTVTRKYLQQGVPPGGKKPIIIALTAHASEKDKQRCVSTGLDDFLMKPASADDFLGMLKKYF